MKIYGKKRQQVNPAAFISDDLNEMIRYDLYNNIMP